MIINNLKISLTKVTAKDEKLLFKWSNEKNARMWSFNSAPIKLSDHKKWFKKNVRNKKIYMWKLKYRSSFCGLVRFKLKNKNIILSYQIIEKFRGRKFGEKMLRMAIKKLRKIRPRARILAKSFTNNSASKKTLIRSGFKFTRKKNNVKTYINEAVR